MKYKSFISVMLSVVFLVTSVYFFALMQKEKREKLSLEESSLAAQKSLESTIASLEGDKKELEGRLTEMNGEIAQRIKKIHRLEGELAQVKGNLSSTYLNYQEAVSKTQVLERKVRERSWKIRKTMFQLKKLELQKPQVNLGSILVSPAHQMEIEEKRLSKKSSAASGVQAKIMAVNNDFQFIVVDAQGLWKPKEELSISDGVNFESHGKIEMIDRGLLALSLSTFKNDFRVGDSLVLSRA